MINEDENWPTLLEKQREAQVELDLMLYSDPKKDPNLEENYDEPYL